MEKFTEAELDIAYNTMISLLDSLSYDSLHMETCGKNHVHFVVEIGEDEIEVTLTHLDTVTLTAAAAAILSRAETLATSILGNTTLH